MKNRPGDNWYGVGYIKPGLFQLLLEPPLFEFMLLGLHAIVCWNILLELCTVNEHGEDHRGFHNKCVRVACMNGQQIIHPVVGFLVAAISLGNHQFKGNFCPNLERHRFHDIVSLCFIQNEESLMMFFSPSFCWRFKQQNHRSFKATQSFVISVLRQHRWVSGWFQPPDGFHDFPDPWVFRLLENKHINLVEN